MKMIKNLIAILLVAMMALSASACHGKDEIAVTIDGIEFTSAYYMCALVNADSEAQSKVYESLSDEEKQKTDIDYRAHKVEDKAYDTWVKDRALDALKDIAAYKLLCEQNKVETDEEMMTSSEQYAEYYWSSYGYSALFEPNGVSKTTFMKYMTDSVYSSMYFDHLYAEGGKEEISADDMKKTMGESFVLVDSISATYTTDDGKEMTDDAKKALKEKFNGYVTAIKDGTKTFEQVYHENNGTKESDDTKEDTTTTDADKKEDAKEELKPVNRHASVMGAKDTGYDNDDFDTVKAMAVGEVKLVELEENGGLVIYVKRDLMADEYYVDQIDSSVRHFIKDDDFEKKVDEFIKGLDIEVVDYAVNRFKVKKIVYPEAQQQG